MLHPGVDGLAAAVDDDRPHADAAHEGDVFEDVADDGGVVHGGPAELDDDGFAPEALDVRQGFDENGGFLDGLFHVWARIIRPRRGGEKKKREISISNNQHSMFNFQVKP